MYLDRYPPLPQGPTAAELGYVIGNQEARLTFLKPRRRRDFPRASILWSASALPFPLYRSRGSHDFDQARFINRRINLRNNGRACPDEIARNDHRIDNTHAATLFRSNFSARHGTLARTDLYRCRG